MPQPSKNEVYLPIDFLLNTKLIEIQRLTSTTLFVFEHNRSLNVLVDWYWLYDAEFSREEPNGPSDVLQGTSFHLGSVIGITYYFRTAALGIHLTDNWTLHIAPRYVERVAWVACNGDEQVIYANRGKIETLRKIHKK